MSSFYRIKGLSKALDGLTVEATDQVTASLVTPEILRIFDTNQIVGDRELSVPVAPKGLMIHRMFLEPTDDPTKRQYAHDNPYGKFELESRTTVGDLELAYSRFEKAIQVSIREVRIGQAPITKYSENFNQNLDLVQATIADSTPAQIEDLIFSLQQLKEDETRGQA